MWKVVLRCLFILEKIERGRWEKIINMKNNYRIIEVFEDVIRIMRVEEIK